MARWPCLLVAVALLLGCGESLCNDLRDPTGGFCGGERLNLEEAIDRARSRQPELGDATLVRATSSNIGGMNVDGLDTTWQLVFVVSDGTDRTLTVTPDRTDVRPGGAPMGAGCAGLGDSLPEGRAATHRVVERFEADHEGVVLGEIHRLAFFYEHECYDAMTPRTAHVQVSQQTETRTNRWFYEVDAAGAVTRICGPCDVNDVHQCAACRAP